MVRNFTIPRDARKDYESTRQYIDHLRGVAEFILFINPDDNIANDAVSVIENLLYP